MEECMNTFKRLIAVFASFALLSLTGVAALAAGSTSGPAPVDLGTAGKFVILSKAAISTTGTTRITGNIGVSPIAATAMTGFGLVLDSSRTFSRSSLVTGKAYAADYAAPTPANLTAAVGAMQTAYTNAAGRTAGVTELGAGNIGGLTLAPGVYKWGTGLTIPTDVTLAGSADAVWIFQVAGTLNISSAKKVILAGGAQAKNVFWQVAGATTLGTYSTFNGTILDKTNIAIQTGAVLNGRALAQTAVTLDANAIQ
jgi:Ice-binding-like